MIFFYYISTFLYFIAISLGIIFLYKPNFLGIQYVRYFIYTAFIFLSIFLLGTGLKHNMLPVLGIFYALLFYIWSITFVYIIIESYFKISFIIVSIIPLLLIFLIISLFLISPYPNFTLYLKNYWFALHIITAFLGYAIFSIGVVVAILLILMDKQLKNKRFNRFFQLYPPMETLQKLNETLLSLAFPIFSVSIVVGLILGHIYKDWDNINWFFDPKVISSLLTWIFYAILLIMKNLRMLSIKKTAYYTLVGFFLILLTFLGMSFIEIGPHSYLSK